MAPPLRDQIEQMALMAMMDGILHTTVPCNCSTCKSENRSKGSTRPQPPKRTGSDSDGVKSAPSKSEASGTCNHNHSLPDSKSTQAPRKSPSQSKSSSASSTNPGRSDKVNALLKADNVQAVFDVLNLTSTSVEEKDLATRIQNVTKDCKLYQETKDQILKLCHEEDVDANAVYGLLAKFRYERNMLTTAVIKGNNEREKSLLCIQRVDHLMYMLQDVAKKKDSKGADVMHKLGDIIMEIHDLAKTPSTLYDEFLDIKEEHLDLLNDHEEMHQKFVDVNSCHEKLHTSHDKLQTEHTKLQREVAEAKKKASMIGSFKNDIVRLEKSVDRSQVENLELRKEVEKLNAELAKVNALKHENAQLKKKVATLTVVPPPVEETQAALHPQSGKKKKGKKGTQEAVEATPATPETVPDIEARLLESNKEHEAHIMRLKKSHDAATQELDQVRTNLKQLDNLLRKAENARDKAVEKLDVEKATSSNWKDIAKGHSTERDRLQAEIDRHISRASRLQLTVGELQQNLASTKSEVVEQGEALDALRRAKEELENRSPTPAMSVASHQTTSLPPDTIRLLRKIRSETSQVIRDFDDSTSIRGEFVNPLELIHHSVHRMASEVERDIEEILSVKGNELPVGNHNNIPEAVLPFTYNNVQQRQTPHYFNRSDHSPQESPQVPPSASLPPYRPMMPPPGLSDPASTSPFSHNSNHTLAHTRAHDSPSLPFSRIVEPPGLSANLGFGRAAEPPPASTARFTTLPSSSSVHSHLSIPSSASISNPNVGVIGSRSTSSKLNATPSPNSTPAPSTGSATGTSATNGSSNNTTSGGGLGNGAVGVDWNMWARSGR